MFENLPQIGLENGMAFWEHDADKISATPDDYLDFITELNPYLAADIQNCAQEVADVSGNDFGNENYIEVFDTVIKTMLEILALVDTSIEVEKFKSKFVGRI